MFSLVSFFLEYLDCNYHNDKVLNAMDSFTIHFDQRPCKLTFIYFLTRIKGVVWDDLLRIGQFSYWQYTNIKW